MSSHLSHPLRRERRTSPRSGRKGAIIILSAILMTFMIAFLALSVDLGYIATARCELRRATDASALAGAAAMIEGPEAAEAKAFEFFARNPVGGSTLYRQEGWASFAGEYLAAHPDHFQVTLGQWDPSRNPGSDPDCDNRFYVDPSQPPCAIWVKAKRPDLPLFFGRLWGGNAFEMSAQAIARYQPRDIALVLDFSGSMNYDSQLRRIYDFGESAREAVETSLAQIYEDLGSPQYGALGFAPQYLTVVGQPPSGPNMPQITVTFRSNDVYVTSTKELSNVVLQFSTGAKQKFEPLSGTTGTFAGTGSNAGKRIDKVWVKSGSNDSGEGPGYGERFEDNYATIKAVFGLDAVAYPYPSGSWESYIDYVKSDSYVKYAGYQKKYGMLTLINYWLAKKPRYDQTPDLWKTRAQPIATVKDAVGLFFNYIQEVPTNDRVAFVIYNSAAQTAQIEHSLTEDFSMVQETIRHRQAAHYDNYTNIGAGILFGRTELEENARPGALKMIVLMTDGNANRPTNATVAKEYAIQQAQLAAQKRYPILTISLGNDADAELCQQIAQITNGYHFNIPGGQSVSDYQDALVEVFRRIAAHRPLALVK
ncbi:MAG: VWA domain-containing protein [Thermoguttaceae bacterium]